jgi:hypothetical protein
MTKGTDMSNENPEPQPTWTDPAVPVEPPTPVAPSAPAAPVAPVVVAPRREGGTWLNILLGAAAVLAVGGVAFAIGRSTAPAAAAGLGTFPGGQNGVILAPNGSFDPGAAPGGGAGGPGLFGSGGLTIEGTVASIDGGTMTITLESGETMAVTLDGDTTYHAATEASEDDVAIGDDVAVRLNGGRIGPGGGDGGAAPQVTADDVTVAR